MIAILHILGRGRKRRTSSSSDGRPPKSSKSIRNLSDDDFYREVKDSCQFVIYEIEQSVNEISDLNTLISKVKIEGNNLLNGNNKGILTCINIGYNLYEIKTRYFKTNAFLDAMFKNMRGFQT